MDIANVVAALKEQRTRIEHAVAALEGLGSSARRGRPPKTRSATGRPMSAAARKRISEAMKQRWAKWKRKSAPKKSVPTKAKTRPAMSAAARKKLSDLMKARWAAKQKAKA
jgi:hypothetical protein